MKKKKEKEVEIDVEKEKKQEVYNRKLSKEQPISFLFLNFLWVSKLFGHLSLPNLELG